MDGANPRPLTTASIDPRRRGMPLQSRYSSPVHRQRLRPSVVLPPPTPDEDVTCHRPHSSPTGCHRCPQTGQRGPFFLAIALTYPRPGSMADPAHPRQRRHHRRPGRSSAGHTRATRHASARSAAVSHGHSPASGQPQPLCSSRKVPFYRSSKLGIGVKRRLTPVSLAARDGHETMLAGFWPHKGAQRCHLLRISEQYSSRSTDV